MEKANEEPILIDRFEAVKPANYGESIAAYLQKSETDSVLRPHQLEVFNDLMSFFADGETRGYINLPTGTGKTVLFVELSKALLEAHTIERSPKILVVTPTKDLVHQTLGRSGEKGFGRFAPDLKLGSYFSDTSPVEKAAIGEQDVVVTTYRSFDTLSKIHSYRPVESFEKDVAQSGLYKQLVNTLGNENARLVASRIRDIPTEKTLVDMFDVILLDEAHHSLGDNARRIIDRLSLDKIVIGFTATPDIDDDRQLTRTLPKKIHELGLNEAIELGLLAPIVPIGIRSGVQVRGSDIYDASGEFIDSKISYLAEDPKRNKIIIDTAKVLAANGIGTIISCIAGGEAQQARLLAQMLNQEGVRAASVYSQVSSEARQAIYQKFNDGEIDVLTFVGVLGEGWDSQRAKGLINARPTRSNIFSKQRLGRITRGSAVGYAIDIYDDFEGQNTPITVADVINEGSVPLGKIIGSTVESEVVSSVVAQIQDALPSTMTQLASTYRENTALIAGLDKLQRGQLYSTSGKLEYATPSAVNKKYSGLTDEIIAKYEELTDTNIPKKLAAQGKSARMVYGINETKKLIYALPNVELHKYFVDNNQLKWIAPQGMVQLFSKRYPEIDTDTIDSTLELAGSNLDWMPVKYLSTPPNSDFPHYRIVKMYRADTRTISDLSRALADYFAA